MSYKVEVIADSSGEFVSNGLHFGSEKEAKDYACDLTSRWMLVRESRVVESEESVNYTFHDWKLRAIEEGKTVLP